MGTTGTKLYGGDILKTLDFYTIDEEVQGSRSPITLLYPEFLYSGVKDLVCKGGSLYAFWDGTKWSDNLDNLIAYIDSTTYKRFKELKDLYPDRRVKARYMNRDSSGVMKRWSEYTRRMPESRQAFNTSIIFSDHDLKREDYATNQLPYYPKDIPTPNFDRLMQVLYNPSEYDKIMWFFGAVLTNSMKDIHKFMFLYGAKGTGKGTILKIIEKVFKGYYSNIDLRLLTSSSEFNTSQVKEIPILIDYDTNLSDIKNDLDLLKLTGHETVHVNKKYSKPYDVVFNGLVVAASNQRYKVRNVDAGIVRRAITIEPSNNRVSINEYKKLMKGIDFELAGIAHKAMIKFKEMGVGYYEDYQDNNMLEATDIFYGFVKENYKTMGEEVTLSRASELYKSYLEDLGFQTTGYKQKVKNELSRYYKEYHNQTRIGGVKYSRVFTNFKHELFEDSSPIMDIEQTDDYKCTTSYLDTYLKDNQAQYSNVDGFPKRKWDDVDQTLKDLDTTNLHFVRLDPNHIVIDFDLKENGVKSLQKNLEASKTFPKTYGEISKSGNGIHLHYIYDGDVKELSSLYDDGIEVKVFTGRSSLRRKFSRSNGVNEIAHISSGLPRKEDVSKMYNNVKDIVWSEKSMRTAIERNLRKEYHANTRPSIDFICKIFKDAESTGVKYDLEDMRQEILIFASKSTNQSKYCIKAINDINYCTIDDNDSGLRKILHSGSFVPNEQLTFFDVEVFPNLLLICYKHYGDDKVYVMYNPSSQEMENFLQYNLVGFNNLRYDNHICYAALMGLDNEAIYRQSQRIINGDNKKGMYGGGYELSYLDVYEVATKKQSLKAWEVELGLEHDEFEYPWDESLDESLWDRCASYCGNDVKATESVFNHITADYEARKILADLSGLSINTKTQNHAAEIIFEGAMRPQDQFVYTDLSELYPGYKFSFGKSTYRGEDPSEGGYVYSEPGVYKDVALLDVASMHPTSLINMNYFGQYTSNYKDLKDARLLIKHKKYDKAKKVMNGKLKPYIEKVESNDINPNDLSYALKIVINIVYGMTSAKFDNKFRHPDNVDNIVAKRGSLFMIDLKNAVQDMGYKVAHIKTDSIKIPNADEKIISFVMEFGEKYGYTFEHEHTYDELALVNKAVYIAHYFDDGVEKWEATGAQFADPYVYKTLFTKENITEEDFMITKNSKTPMYLGDLFIGKTGAFFASKSGDQLIKKVPGKDKPDAVTGTKGYLWKRDIDYTDRKDVDMRFYDSLVQKAIEAIKKVGDIDLIVDDIPQQYLENKKEV